MKVAVVGLGKIGLPLAAQYATKGVATVGCDINPAVVEDVQTGRAPFPGEAGLEELLPRLVSEGRLTATTETADAVSESDVTVVVVPLVTDDVGNPSFEAIDSATRDIGRGLVQGHLVIYETTLPVGTTRERFGGLLGAVSGLRPGIEFNLAFAPERVFSGRIFRDLRSYPKLVGGVDPESTTAAVAFYEQVLDFDETPDLARANGVWDLGSTEAAELAKLAETTYRDVNIALANEFAAYAEEIGIDINPVIEAANSQPFSHIHRPGLVGGHCIPVYPHFYLSGHPSAQLPRAGRTVNNAVPRRVVDRVESALGTIGDKTIAVLGASYRGGVKETAFSGVFGLVDEITRRRGKAQVHDPLYTDEELMQLGFLPYHLGGACDAAIIQADHDQYRELEAAQLPGCRVLFDVRGIVPNTLRNELTLLRLGSGAEAGDDAG